MTSWATLATGLLACVFAVLLPLQRSLYSAALCLLAVVFLAAGLFMLSGAHLVAFLQVMIYAGAVMVLVVVTIMASPPAERRVAALAIPKPLALGAAAALLVELVAAAAAARPFPAGSVPAELDAWIGPALFRSYAVGTEAVTLLLFLSALAVLDARSAK